MSSKISCFGVDHLMACVNWRQMSNHNAFSCATYYTKPTATTVPRWFVVSPLKMQIKTSSGKASSITRINLLLSHYFYIFPIRVDIIIRLKQGHLAGAAATDFPLLPSSSFKAFLLSTVSRPFLSPHLGKSASTDAVSSYAGVIRITQTYDP